MNVGDFSAPPIVSGMTEHEFIQLRDFVYTRSHIFCTNAQKPLFERKVRFRLVDLHLSSFQEYYEFITEHQEQEFTQLIDFIAVHETSFFRIREHFTGLEKLVFPQLFQKPSVSPLRIWSAGCSTGEESYSIVISFLEALAQQPSTPFQPCTARVIATDISPLVIRKAREGVYSSKQVRKVQQPLLDKYFHFHNDQYDIHEDVKTYITFTLFNLIHLATVPTQSFDIIFCRNVLIYFDRQAQIALLKHLCRLLPEGGYLFLGDAESIHTFPEAAKHFDFVESGDAIMYQKRGVSP